MSEWTLADAQRCLGEVLRRAEKCGPQRVEGPEGTVVVVGADEFDWLLVEASLSEEDLRGLDEVREGEQESFVEYMQRSPLAEAFRAGEISPEEWDKACRIGR